MMFIGGRRRTPKFVSMRADTGVRPYKHYILNAHSRTASGCTHFLTP